MRLRSKDTTCRPRVSRCKPRHACRCDGSWQERRALLTPLSMTILAARAHGKAVLDGVHLDLEDANGFALACAQGRAMGFDGKTLIHPKTISVANQAFAPAKAEVERAKRIIEAFSVAAEAGSALVVHNGQLIEELHLREAKRLVSLAEAVSHCKDE